MKKLGQKYHFFSLEPTLEHRKKIKATSHVPQNTFYWNEEYCPFFLILQPSGRIHKRPFVNKT